jgi:hypothetical protein
MESCTADQRLNNRRAEGNGQKSPIRELSARDTLRKKTEALQCAKRGIHLVHCNAQPGINRERPQRALQIYYNILVKSPTKKLISRKKFLARQRIGGDRSFGRLRRFAIDDRAHYGASLWKKGKQPTS